MGSNNAGGRVVMVSGANRGMGAAIAARLAADGYRLSLGARRTDALAESAPDIEPERLLLNRHDAHRRRLGPQLNGWTPPSSGSAAWTC